METRKSWTIKNDKILDDLVTLMALTPKDEAIMLKAKPEAEALSTQLSKSFYNRLQNYQPTAEFVQGKTDHPRGKKPSLQRERNNIYQIGGQRSAVGGRFVS